MVGTCAHSICSLPSLNPPPSICASKSSIGSRAFSVRPILPGQVPKQDLKFLATSKSVVTVRRKVNPNCYDC